ncbi:MAG: GNAT family N-acetyltransferase [Alphaproteobacteria bacterium]|nr:GNAT family N-acetyltransferase [Alphaproteobacteria bacterium]
MTRIRRAGPADAETLAALGARTFADTFGHLYRREDLEFFLNKNHSRAVYETALADDAYALWVAENDAGEAVGYGVAGPCSLPVPGLPENSGELSRLYLTRQAQGSGLGESLARAMLDWLTENFSHVYLSVYADNPRAQRLYQKLGFIKIHDYFYEVGEHRDPEWIMELQRAE